MDTHQAEVEEEEEEVMAEVAVAAATVAIGMHRDVLSAEHCMLSPARLVCCHAITSTAWYIFDHQDALCFAVCMHKLL